MGQRYKIVQAIRYANAPAEFVITECQGEEALFANMKVRGGGHFNGRVDAHRWEDGKPRRIPLRDELHGQPRFTGFCGPMYDGPDLIRYEDATANDILSR